VSAITLEHVHKAYRGAQTAVHDVSLTIRHGELLVLVGPSGSGKSTVLRLIAGLEVPTSGRVLLDGDEVTDWEPRRRDLAMVFQNYALYPHKTVRENLAFALEVRGVAGPVIQARVQEAAEALGLEPFLDRRPAQLSGGQRQRVALGRAIVREPRAFLLDEPLSNLDPALRLDTRTELARLHRRLGATLVYVTHDQEEAMTLGTRLAIMRDGRVEQVGAPLDVYRAPANVFVATFLGSPAMNLWRCACTRSGEGVRITGDGVSFELAGVDVAAPSVVAGVRPHDIGLVGPEGADGVGVVESIEPLGPTAIVQVRLDGASRGTTRVVTAEGAHPMAGARTGIRVRRDALHLFDGQDGTLLRPGSREQGLG